MLEQLRELFHGNASFSNQRPQGSFGKFFMIGDGKASVRRVDVSNDNVAAVLRIECVSDFLKRLDCFAPRNYRQLHPPAISMTSSKILGGTGSP